MQLLAERMRRIDLRCMRDFRPNEANAIDYRRHVCGNTYTHCSWLSYQSVPIARSHALLHSCARTRAQTLTHKLPPSLTPYARTQGAMAAYASPFGLARSTPLHYFGIRRVPCQPQRAW